jgi:hypothetical protein
MSDFTGGSGDDDLVGGDSDDTPRGWAATTHSTWAAAVFVYTSATGALAFDADGNGAGAAVNLALLGNKPSSITTADIVLGP